MTNSTPIPIPIPARLLTALLAAGLPAEPACSFGPLARALASELPLRVLPRVLLRLRRHLLFAERTPPVNRPAGAAQRLRCAEHAR
ncbi:hypothetical protein C5C31_07740 [Rathayibacter rathayi]|uniref:Secreted protein n=1 Tax=Rathayibacter rathayi TaxID=33887 RepID=A0ABD6WBC5_RATRA|nr:hypothetical protein [Rathayibacter rathayi]MWV73816.1 hypothetical protein [Rathayibacter rathayi NCPPB 2980 = VKM Ac-1601]PPF15732.1 hypothetical protein C5C04_02345 [Rathayibacter rathayi]PPF50819.1 hypothetical protein C5C08_04195 [Rathayibacter rathayi]PPG15461.1 hypothetical protein C5C11_02385 [Rathayibacter rathayi]PPG70675.1 hypothetical protein C5C16_03805 [Rathayibacter rathayi]